MPKNDQLKALVDQMPDPDLRGMYTENIDKQKIEKAVAAIHKGGRAHAQGLIDMLAEPGSPEDVKPRYALHCLTNHVLVVKDEPGRKALCQVLAEELDSDRPLYVRKHLCEELGWAGRKESVAALGKALTVEGLSGPAAMALVAIRDGSAEQLRAAWPQAKGESRRHIMDALAALGDAKSASLFQKALSDDDREVRIAAVAGLAAVGEASAADPLLKVADAAKGWERIQTTSNCLTLAEKLAAAGNKSAARRIYQHLKKNRDDSESHVREAADRGLAATA